jgi:hypothetical protein
MTLFGIAAATAGAATLVFAATAPGLAGTAETMEKECLAQLNMPPAACTCIGERAESERAPKVQEFVIAMITQNQAMSARLRGELTVAEMTRAASWMTKTPTRCAAQ